MGAIGGEEMAKWEKDIGIVNGGEEKILVLVRLKPLSEKEISMNEVSDWECINDSTILYRNSLQERSGLPTAYSFDKVFRADCPTKKVYEEGTKDIALSVVTGINSTIFAYGQTSSGKTYTMNGITEYTVADIYDYIAKHKERAFVLKFAAMEIYNEVARDLLSMENTPLRLLDDPDKGTIIERLTEETLIDWSHLKKLLSICEAQRQIGETSLNEKSSRSHQILRLTIESSAREFMGRDNSTTLTASVNFVDLAGSERASQAFSIGQRLKEGCHINRSLLTLGTVIRKLSKGRNGHVNYRDSKLTRILQPSLGGNARTAIICTLSPARSHIEQSRNTLLFACCAKEVTTNAQVNVVMSDKALVKQLQREVSRLESELRTPGPTSDHAALLRNKDLQIEKLEKEVRELRKQRDLAHAQLEDLLNRDVQENITAEDEYSVSGLTADVTSGTQLAENSSNHSPSDLSLTSTSNGSKFDITRVGQGKEDNALGLGEDSDDICKEVRCIEVDASGGCMTTELDESSENSERISSLSVSKNEDITYQEPVSSLPTQARKLENGDRNGALEKNVPDVQFIMESSSGPKSLKWARSGIGRPDIVDGSSSHVFDTLEQLEATPPHGLEKSFSGRPQSVRRKHWKVPLFTFGANGEKLSRSNSQSSIGSALVDELKPENVPGDEDIPSVGSFVAGLKEMAKCQFGNQIDDQVQGRELVAEISGNMVRDVGLDWQLQFRSLQRSIVELWETCNVSLVHRTYFFLLFQGDTMDSIYMEVELRRLSFLKETFSKPNPPLQDDQASTVTSSLKELFREKQMLIRLIKKRLTKNERDRIYDKWGISLNSKQRRLQLVQKLWSNSEDMDHVWESAVVVAKLIRFSMQGHAIKEMFGLSFTPPNMQHRSFSWKNSKRSLV